MSDPLVVGIDVHLKNNTVAFMDATGQRISSPFVIRNNRPGATSLAHTIRDTAIEYEFDSVHVAATLECPV